MIKKHQSSLQNFLDKAHDYAEGLAYQELLKAKKKENKMDIVEKNNVDPLKKGKIGVWLTPDELRIIQNALVSWSFKVIKENESIIKIEKDLKEISLSFDNQHDNEQEDDNGQGSNAAHEQDR